MLSWRLSNGFIRVPKPFHGFITCLPNLQPHSLHLLQTHSPSPPVLDLLVAELSSAATKSGKVFLYGVGREGLMLKALCMRLAHLGLSAHLVFDMTTPPITPNDLVIASAGPGGFSTVDTLCSVAQSHGVRVLLLMAQPETGSCVKHASVVGYVPAQTMADVTKVVRLTRSLESCCLWGVCMRVLCLCCF